MKTKIISILLLALFLFVSVAQAGDWRLNINAMTGGTHTYCILGERQDASDGIDQYDVPHPPFFPPGRCFIYLKEKSFQAPYKNLWYEYKHHSDSKIFNLSCFWYPWDDEGVLVTLDWKPESFMNSGYTSVVLQPMGLNMLKERYCVFWSEPYQTTSIDRKSVV
jgi:hypothetical protein